MRCSCVSHLYCAIHAQNGINAGARLTQKSRVVGKDQLLTPLQTLGHLIDYLVGVGQKIF